MSNVQQLLESAAGSWKSLQSDAAKLAGKWAKTGLLEGLVEVDRNNMSLLLENQAKQLVTVNSHSKLLVQLVVFMELVVSLTLLTNSLVQY